ncbi:MAG TPA: threonine ammonia-lyase [Opitutales bacterium]|nr:threonine ammonia-lyase [Opitutales bacterium]
MIDLKRIEEAGKRIWPELEKTPWLHSEALSEMCGCHLILKFENFHRTGSFKERGALNKLLCMTPDQLRHGVVTASAGNHGQALAYHAGRLGARAAIVMPEKTPLVKVVSTRRWGAEVILAGSNYDEAMARARKIEREEGLVFVHGFDDPEVVAGQGTLALEMREAGVEWDVLLMPIGGGGLIAGNAIVSKEIFPESVVFGVEPQTCASMQFSLSEGHPAPYVGHPSLADGLAVKSVGKVPFDIVQKRVDDIFTVSEEEIANAILVFLEVEKTLVEGAGAATLAALLNREDLRKRVAGKRVLLPLSGGNIDVNVLSKIIDRGLAKAGRLARFRVMVADEPGSLHRVTDSIAKGGANILDIFHDRIRSQTAVGEVAIDLVIETRGPDQLEKLKQDLREDGIRVEEAAN